MSRSATFGWLVGVVALLAIGLIPEVRADEPDPDASPALCGELDTPENGIQGDVPKDEQESGRAEQGYNCGLALVGHHDLEGGGNADMAWSDHCAYVKHPEGLKVVDVKDPTKPKLVGRLESRGAMSGAEGIMARTTADRAVLVVGLNGAEERTDVPVDVYDVSNCANPKHRSTVYFPENMHNLGLSMDATKVYASMPLQVVDITDPAHPGPVEQFQCELAAQAPPGYLGLITWNGESRKDPQCAAMIAHEFDFSPDDERMYVGDQMPGESNLYIVDLTTTPRDVISWIPGPAHGVRRADIGGKRHLLHSDETLASPAPLPPTFLANGCVPEPVTPLGGAAQAFLTDISAEAAPARVSELKLAINDPTNCAARNESGVKATVHYNEVDDADDATFALLGMSNAGVRLFDIRNPASPKEVAYFNPGQLVGTDGSKVLDTVFAHVHYEKSTGHVWLSTRNGGFWVLELEPQVRAALELPEMPTEHPDGAPARTASLHIVDAIPPADLRTAFAYCTT